MRIDVSELVNSGDQLVMRDRHPSDNKATLCRLTIVEGHNIAAEVQLTAEAAVVLAAWLTAKTDRM